MTLSTAAICRIAGGVLVILVGGALGTGGFQLLRGGPKAWPDIVTNETTVWRTSVGMIVVAAILLIAGIAAAGNMPWGGNVAAIATIVVVFAAFWVTCLNCGNIRPLHTGTNIAVAAIILGLLWFGYFGHAR